MHLCAKQSIARALDNAFDDLRRNADRIIGAAIACKFLPPISPAGFVLAPERYWLLTLARHKMHAQQNSLRLTLKRALLMSAGYALAALVLGAGRELVGHGSLFADAGNVLGNWAKPLQLQLFRADMGFLLAVLAPGAFVGLGLGVALYNWLWLQLKSTKQPA